MEEPEVPTEHLHEEMHHHAAGHKKTSWVMWVALSSALLAALAAVTSLMAGHHANEAMIDQLKASDSWNYYQAKGIKQSLLASKADLMRVLGKEVSEKDEKKLKDYETEKEEIKTTAEHHELGAKEHLETHVILARGVTLFQVAIAIGAISVLTHRRQFWWVSLVFGAIGVFFLIQGIQFEAKHHEAPDPTPAVVAPVHP